MSLGTSLRPLRNSEVATASSSQDGLCVAHGEGTGDGWSGWLRPASPGSDTASAAASRRLPWRKREQAVRGVRGILQNTLVLLSGKVANAMLGLGSTAVAARALGVHDFGMLILIQAFAAAVADCVTFQSWQTVLHYGVQPLAAGARPLLQRLLRFTLLLDVASGGLGVLVGMALVVFFRPLMGWPAEITSLSLVYCASIACRVMATPTGVLRLLDRFDLLAGQTTTASFVRLLGGLLVWSLGGQLAGFVGVWFAAEAAACAVLFGLAWRELHRKGLLAGARWRWSGLTAGLPSGIWRFAWTTNLNSALTLAFGQVGILLVGGVLDPSSAAFYRIARQIANAVAKPARLVLPAMYPELTRLWRAGALRDLHRVAIQIAAGAGATATALLLLALVAGAPLIELVVGPAFRPAAPLMIWLLVAAVIDIWALPLEPLLISTGRPAAAVRVRAGVALVYLPLFYLALREIGVLGAGYVSVLAAVLLALAQFAFVRREASRSRGQELLQ